MIVINTYQKLIGVLPLSRDGVHMVRNYIGIKILTSYCYYLSYPLGGLSCKATSESNIDTRNNLATTYTRDGFDHINGGNRTGLHEWLAYSCIFRSFICGINFLGDDVITATYCAIAT